MKTDERKAVAVFSTDWHIKRENITEIIDLVRRKCELSRRLDVKNLVCLGDVFESRIAQREDVLSVFHTILDIVKEYNLKLTCIPGNHDKTDYSSSSSFLTPFKEHPAFFLIDMAGGIPIPDTDIRLRFLPYFEESRWVKGFNELCEYMDLDSFKFKNILCTHIAVTGSRNNDGEYVSSGISTQMFDKFFKVFSGHYHDQQKIGSNFYHLPSIQQNNFGEDQDKGFTVLYSDGSHELVRSDFKKYIKVKIDLDTVSADELNDLKRKHKGSKDNIRFEFIGQENVLKSLNKEDYTSLGIDFKSKLKEIQNDIEYSDKNEVIEFTKESIRDEFRKFCDKEKLQYEKGEKFLKIKLQ